MHCWVSGIGVWRLRESLWCKVLFSKYGRSSINSTGVGFRSPLVKLSPWVMDLVSSPSSVFVIDEWFWDGMVRRIGDGSNTRFWHDLWVGSSTLATKYKRLYNLSTSPYDNICNFGSWVVLSKNKKDYWEWKHDKSKKYSVKSPYNLIRPPVQQSPLTLQNSYFIWKSKAPPKVITFVWRVFQDRIPTMDAHLRRGVSFDNGGGSFCSLCND
ncbi:hypothetical protein Lal_00046959 [Lupinus albus]|nr:hypothetical protein Lal_00046959 [Lupinus albus]